MTSAIVTDQLKKQHFKVSGEVTEVQKLRDGSTLMKDDVRFYKVDGTQIKLGFFRKGKFHYSKNNIVLIN